MGDKPSKGFKSDGHRLGGAGQDDSSPTKQAPPPKKSVFKKKKAPRAPVDPAERAKQAEERRRAAEQRSNAFDNKLKSQRAKKVGIPLSCYASHARTTHALSRDLRKCRWGVGAEVLKY